MEHNDHKSQHENRGAEKLYLKKKKIRRAVAESHRVQGKKAKKLRKRRRWRKTPAERETDPTH